MPHHWRGFPDFGCGAMGDMACHILGAANMALRLTAPTSLECINKQGAGKYTLPQRTIIRFDFPARGSMPPVTIYWRHGPEKRPHIEGASDDEAPGGDSINGSLFIGDKGLVTTGGYGEDTRLVPASLMKDYKLPPRLLRRAPGHFRQGRYRDWIRACKGGEPACSNFSVAARFVPWMLLGVIAMRFEGKLSWDAGRGRSSSPAEANRDLKPKFRKGWNFA